MNIILKLLLKSDNVEKWFYNRFKRYERNAIEEQNSKFETSTVDYLFFECPGAGRISISVKADACTGDVCGFDIGVSWGNHGYTGGVIGREEARKLAYHILDQSKIADAVYGTEEQAVKNLNDYLSAT